MIIPTPSEKLEVPRATTPTPSVTYRASTPTPIVVRSITPTPSTRSSSIGSSFSLPSSVYPTLDHDSSSLSPPAYSEKTRKPLTFISYTFWPQTEIQNSMILAPPIDISDAGPSYFISVKMNLFTPNSYVTAIRRNSHDGEVVGDFEIGPTSSRRPNTVYIRGNEYPLSDIFKAGHQPFRWSWTWNSLDPNKPAYLFWDDSAAQNVLTCFSSKDKTNVLARFVPPYQPRKHGQAAQMTRLEVSPQGHEFFDDIVMSALIAERLRTQP